MNKQLFKNVLQVLVAARLRRDTTGQVSSAEFSSCAVHARAAFDLDERASWYLSDEDFRTAVQELRALYGTSIV